MNPKETARAAETAARVIDSLPEDVQVLNVSISRGPLYDHEMPFPEVHVYNSMTDVVDRIAKEHGTKVNEIRQVAEDGDILIRKATEIEGVSVFSLVTPLRRF